MRTCILVFICIAAAYLLSFSSYIDDNDYKKNFQNSLVYFCCNDHYMHISQAIMSTVANKYSQLKVTKTEGDWVFDKYGGVNCLEGLKLYVDGFKEPISYEGGLSASDIIDWVDKTMTALTVEAKTLEEIQEIIDNNEVVVLFFTNNDLSVYPSIINSVNTLPNYYGHGDEVEGSISPSIIWEDTVFIYSKDSKVKEFYQVKDETLILFDKFNKTQQIFEGPFSAESVRKFLGSINSMTRVSRGKYFSLSNTPLNTIFLVRSNDEAGYQAEKAFREAVKSLRGRMLLYICDSCLFDPIFRFSTSDLPAIRIIQPAQTKLNYAYEEDNFTTDSIKNFVDKFFAGKLTPYFISDPIPVNEYENNVRVVVGETFEKIVLDKQKDVLLMIHDSFEEKDPAFLDLLILLADKFKNVEDFVLAKINLDTNEINGTMIPFHQGGQLWLYPKHLKHSPIIESFFLRYPRYPRRIQTDIKFYVHFLKRCAFLVQEAQSKLPRFKPQAFDIISWAEQQPHSICTDPYPISTSQLKIMDTDNVVSVVEGNFSEIVFDDKNDIFLVAYTPGDESDDITKFLQVAGIFKDVKNLVFAMIDSSVNKVAGVVECSTPVYWFYPKNRKYSPIMCPWFLQPDERDLLSFLKEDGNVSIPFASEADLRDDLDDLFDYVPY